MNDYIVSAPGHNLVILEAGSVSEARSIGRELLGVSKLPKHTVVKSYSDQDYETSWNRHYL